MATLGRLQSRLPSLGRQYYFLNRTADEYRKGDHKAAVLIQSWFRGCRVRAYIRYLHQKMTVIQKWWRGYLGRKYFRQMVKTEYFNMKMNFYNEMAVRIQKRWRGYHTRKEKHNYYARKKYLEGICRNNENLRERMAIMAASMEEEKRKIDHEREEQKKDYQARKMHYLLSTEQIPGVYNSPLRKFPDPMEYRLQKAKPLSHRKPPVKKDATEDLSSWLACTRLHSFPRSQALPPIDRKKIQGPFRDIAEVLQQRYKPLEPTLRVATSISAVERAREELKREEWRSQLNDNVFLPFSSYHKNEKYEPLIHTSTKYGPRPYGTENFREEEPKKWVTSKGFKTVFPSLHLFDRFGKEYSKAGQIV
ncbi:spermatogenesis-associated protein 17 [Tachyglossus aculeatus]|uniref:spermatogenesis-associated protein 17 n=1 Tax=Tachyglossus aculeatus TaxID=9261 RepID=UPI0018F73957|nr:spermatogenesis-associated protein 17 [Tachyglossus aculeatus]XP_038617106.1 spermatogenesis-associated protein 17 [Tachyglossus aculeatus]XP_038617107.1 spermatogenesis-associated protein 17 [Tachyglossus aculeatus]